MISVYPPRVLLIFGPHVKMNLELECSLWLYSITERRKDSVSVVLLVPRFVTTTGIHMSATESYCNRRLA